MAWLEQKSTGAFHIVFRLEQEKYRRSLKTKCAKEASARKVRVEENLRLIEAGRMSIPGDADLVSFLLSDGKLTQKVKPQKQLSVGQLYARYLENLPEGSVEQGSLSTAGIHLNHISSTLGAHRQLRTISTEHLQSYINSRALQPGRHGRNVSAVTIKKELATFRSLWNWAKTHGYVSKPLPLHGLNYPKVDEKPPFKTKREIEREIGIQGLSDEKQCELWHSLFLSSDELMEVLQQVAKQSSHLYLYPMAALAAYTGARRSELCRSLESDVNLEQQTIIIREKKRTKGKRTFRQVPLTSTLSQIMKEWLEQKPDSPYTFPCDWIPRLSKIREIPRRSVLPTEARNHLEQALRKSKWSVLPGWHVFRHSFISNCASRGIDQRMIDDWVGHQTDEQRRRYRHLFPDTQKREIDRVF